MRQILITLCSIAISHFSLSQALPKEYYRFIRNAETAYHSKDYKASANYYASAFQSSGLKGLSNDRYNAACCLALSGNEDSAFFQLERVVINFNYSNYGHIIADADLNSLHEDKRWKPLLELIKQNKEKAEVKLNKPLAKQLDSIYTEDQKYRQMMGEVESKHGFESKEMKSLFNVMNRNDSINLITVTYVLDNFGWLGADVVGHQGNSTLFLVIQHSNPKTQEKYLPMMRDAVIKGNAQADALALLEDRVALGQGKKQIYGSQIRRDEQTKKYYFAPIEDEAKVNERRASAGLEPIEEYADRWNIEYKFVK